MKNWTNVGGGKQWVASVYFVTVSITSIGYGAPTASMPSLWHHCGSAVRLGQWGQHLTGSLCRLRST